MCELLERRNYVFPFLSEDFYSISSILLTLYLLQEYAKKDVGGFGPRAPMAEHLAGDLFLNKEFTGYAHLLLPESLIYIYFPDCFVCLFLISSWWKKNIKWKDHCSNMYKKINKTPQG